MKTFQFSKPLKRISQGVNIQFENVLYQNVWHVFDVPVMTETMTFKPNQTLVVARSGKEVEGSWKYTGGDSFQLKLDGASYWLHLVHLDNNLLIFELYDTRMYSIFVSQNAMQTLALTSLDSIEYYIEKLKKQIHERVQNPSRSHGGSSNILPILVMGGVYSSLFRNHDHSDFFHPDSDKDGKQVSSEDEFIDEEGEWNEDGEMEDFSDVDNDFEDIDDEEDGFEDIDGDGFEDVDNAQDVYYEQEDDWVEEPVDTEFDEVYDEYGGLTEEEIIYDYLENQED